VEVLIYRDPRESTRRCSLTPLRGLPGLRFVEHRPPARLDVGERTLLHPEGELLTAADARRGLLLVDCAWRRVDPLLASLDGTLHRRRLPELTTAYPRRSKLFQDPAAGLASVEALYAALWILGEPRPELLAGYHFAAAFLEANDFHARAPG
jgi:pre-rRNA-processing protein TSR3